MLLRWYSTKINIWRMNRNYLVKEMKRMFLVKGTSCARAWRLEKQSILKSTKGASWNWTIFFAEGIDERCGWRLQGRVIIDHFRNSEHHVSHLHNNNEWIAMKSCRSSLLLLKHILSAQNSRGFKFGLNQSEPLTKFSWLTDSKPHPNDNLDGSCYRRYILFLLKQCSSKGFKILILDPEYLIFHLLRFGHIFTKFSCSEQILPLSFRI